MELRIENWNLSILWFYAPDRLFLVIRNLLLEHFSNYDTIVV